MESVEDALNLSCYSRIVSTKNSTAQDYFNKGLIQMYGFNHEDAVRWYKKALELDNNLAIAYWGISYCLNINYNNACGLDRKNSFLNFQKAKELLNKQITNKDNSKQTISEFEKDIINSMENRFLCNTDINEQNKEDILFLENQYGNALKNLYYNKNYSNDPDVALMYSESLMNKRPWALWNKEENGEYHKDTFEIKSVLENAIKLFPLHPGCLHLYIHLMELSPNPEKAIYAANQLSSLQNMEQGHLIHMPSHIYMWTGDYELAVNLNIKALEADYKYVNISGSSCEFYKFYRLHNIHFCCWASMFDGQYETALKYAKMLQEETKLELLDKSPGADYLEGFYTIIWHVYIRFGKWNEIINISIPDDYKENYPASTSTDFYAKGIAYASLGNIIDAEKYKDLYITSLDNKKLNTRLIFNNTFYTSNTKGVLNIGKYMLFGEIEYRKGNYKCAFEYLTKAVDFCDNIIYDEPWGWMIPPRHALGALLLEQGQYDEAILVYKKDLETNKNNLWSVGGILNCYKEKNKQNSNEINQETIQELTNKFKKLTKRSDIKFKSSCYCSISAGAIPPQ